jgi:hypothetical protein
VVILSAEPNAVAKATYFGFAVVDGRVFPAAVELGHQKSVANSLFPRSDDSVGETVQPSPSIGSDIRHARPRHGTAHQNTARHIKTRPATSNTRGDQHPSWPATDPTPAMRHGPLQTQLPPCVTARYSTFHVMPPKHLDTIDAPNIKTNK